MLISVRYMRTAVLHTGRSRILGEGEALVNVNQDYSIYPRDKD